MTTESKSPLRRLLPNTIFARLFGLLFAAIVISQVLPSVLIFAFNSSAPPFYPDDRPPPRDDMFFERGPGPDGMPGPDGAPRMKGPPPGFGGPLSPHIPMHMPPEFIASQVLQLLALTLAAWIGARFIARPIEALAQAASRLGGNLNSPPIDETGPDEAVRAARVFNRMQQRIRAQLDERARFLAAVSHDLRTPLTRMRLRVAQLDDETAIANSAEKLVREKLGDDIDEMTLMIDATLNYLRGEAQPETWQLLDIHALLESMTEDAQEAGREVTLTGSATPLSVQPLSLRRCIGNLLDNALLYGGKAEISLRDTLNGVLIEIRDRGPGIPENKMNAVFEPFVRLEGSRNRHTGGVGLGLAIARETARRNGGELTLRNAVDGGLIAALELPR